MSEPTVHPALAPIEFLLGTWTGEGKGEYPTIDPFSYKEEVRFWHLGRPVLLYAQRTWASETQEPMHTEMGYWRPQQDGSIEVVLAHAFGIVEMDEGRIIDNRIELASKALVSTSTAKKVDALARTFEVHGDVLTYTVDMAFGGRPLQHHLGTTLHRAG